MKTTAGRKLERKKALFARHFHSQERVRFIKSLPCEVTGSAENVVNAHMKSRAAGGTYRDIVPLSWMVHYDFDVLCESDFEQKYGRSKASIRVRAEYYQRLWEEQT